MNPHFPKQPWEPSPAFMQFLDELPRTPQFEAVLRKQRAERERERQQAEDAAREIERIRAEAMRVSTPRKKVGWGGGTKVKHVVTGRLHLIEDDDEKARRGYAQMNRFIITGGNNE